MTESRPGKTVPQLGLARAGRELRKIAICVGAAALAGSVAAVALVYFATPYVLDYFGVQRGGGLHGGGEVAATLLFAAWGAAGLLGAVLGGLAGFWLGLKWRLWSARREVVDRVRGAVVGQAIEIVRKRNR